MFKFKYIPTAGRGDEITKLKFKVMYIPTAEEDDEIIQLNVQI
jgi:hypothetical protein